MRPCWKDRLVEVGIVGEMGYSAVERLCLSPQHMCKRNLVLPSDWLSMRKAHCVDLMIFGLALQRGDAGAMETELESLRLQVRSLDEELLRHRSIAGTKRSAVQMERSTQQRLLERVRTLELENAVLKEDMLPLSA